MWFRIDGGHLKESQKARIKMQNDRAKMEKVSMKLKADSY